MHNAFKMWCGIGARLETNSRLHEHVSNDTRRTEGREVSTMSLRTQSSIITVNSNHILTTQTP